MPDAQGERAGAPRQLVHREGGEMVAHPARKMQRIAAHPDLVIRERHRRRRGIERPANAMRYPQHRHHRPLDKRHRARQGIEAGGDPAALVLEKTQAEFGRDAVRQDQLDPPLGRVDPQSDAARPRADPDRERGAEVERQRLPADFGQRRFAAQPDRTRRDPAKTRHSAAFAEKLQNRARDRRKSFPPLS